MFDGARPQPLLLGRFLLFRLATVGNGCVSDSFVSSHGFSEHTRVMDQGERGVQTSTFKARYFARGSRFKSL
ncbi:MAG: hypothetical protein C5B50_08000 [Verrucomicrobia bacterium]|nr:MAG: hypothetical protein C5B50_08000 [Verrucomicrobiota bacterium]